MYGVEDVFEKTILYLTGNSVPFIDGPIEIEVSVFEEANATITFSDTDSEDTISVTYTIPEGATYDMSTGMFKWTPEDMSEVEIRLAGSQPLPSPGKTCGKPKIF